PEIVNEFELGNSVATGIIDMAYLTSAFYSGNAPGVEFYFATQLSSDKLRQNGFYDFFNGLHRKGNLEFIGGGDEITDFWYIYLTKQVKQLSDLKGMRIGDGTVALKFLKEVGASSVTIGAPDAYTALERGVIDGILYPRRLVTALKLEETLKYYIDAPVYRNDTNYIMNLDKWKSLPEDLKKIMKETAIEIEKEAAHITLAIEQKAAKDIAAAGIKAIQFTPSETQKTIDLLYNSEWDQAIERYPNLGPKIKNYLSTSDK
ncbi:TRAP transporter substrate-binding protein DctP, partial [bacterium]|nr:TRAP transporter substrate-binding protein DctP [bacterium]